MRIEREKTQYNKYAFSFDFNKSRLEYCRYLKGVLGWKEFNFSDGKWRFNDVSIALMIKDKFPETIIDETVSNDIYDKNIRDAIEIKREANVKTVKSKEHSSLLIRGLKDNLYPYQKLGVEFFVNSNGKAILADVPGLGKTAQSLGYIVYSNIKRTLIVCPASVKFSWENEVSKWTNLKSFVVGPNTELSDIPHDTHVVIINFDILKKFYNELMSYRWDCMIVDEAHFVKNRTAIRTKVVNQLSKKIPSVILLTGTPILSRPVELFNLLHIVDPITWNNWYEYTRKYCEGKNTYWGYEAKGASNLDELNRRIEKYFLRRTKDQVLSELPPKIRIEVPVDLKTDDMKKYRLAVEDLAQYLKDHKKKGTRDILKSLQAEKLTRLNILREIASMGKIDTAIELIQNIIDSGEKVVVFSSFNEPLKRIQSEFIDSSVMLVGETPIEERGDIVKRFQEDDNVKIFLGGIKSAGVGITLTSATNVVFVDYSWNPADHAQAEDRIHRPGQKASNVNIYQITSRGTIDHMMRELLNKKQEIFDRVIDGYHVDSEESIVDDMIKSIVNQRT